MRIWTSPAFALLLLPSFALQDTQPEPGKTQPDRTDEKVRELVGRLGAEDPFAREDAYAELVQLGEAALPRLKAAARDADDAEVRDRATAAVEEIEDNLRLRKVYRRPTRADFAFEKTSLKEALEAVGEEFDVGVAGISSLPEKTIDLQLKDATLLQVMDAIGSRAGIGYDLEEGTLRVSSSKAADYPAAYSEAFRLQVTQVIRTISDDFTKRTATVRFQVTADWGPEVKPLPGYGVELVEAVDENGAKIPVGGGNRARNRAWVKLRAMGRNIPEQQWVALTNVSPEVTRLKSLRFRGMFRFPLDEREVTVKKLENQHRQEIGDYTLRVTQTTSSYVILQLTANTEEAEHGLGDLMDFDSIRLYDEADKKHTPQQIYPSGSGANTMQFYVMYPPELQNKGAKKMGFKVREVRAMEFEFELKDFGLPR